MNNMFPRTNVGGISVSRMIIGTNWILGYSHTSPAADKLIKRHNGTKKAIADLIEVFVNAGVDTVMGLLDGNPLLVEGINEAESRTGKKIDNN